jgi:hypothetical protein
MLVVGPTSNTTSQRRTFDMEAAGPTIAVGTSSWLAGALMQTATFAPDAVIAWRIGRKERQRARNLRRSMRRR